MTIPGLTPEVWTIEVRARGFAQETQAVHLNGTGTTSVSARLVPGVEMFGVVRDEAGNGLPMAGLSVSAPDMSNSQTQWTKTAADGSYRFSHLPVGHFTLEVSKDGYVEGRPDVVITAPPGGQQEVNLTLRRRPDGGSVRGTVRAGDGKPIAGALLVNRGNSSSDVRKATTDAQGRFRLDDVYKSWSGHELFVKARGFAPQHLSFKPGGRQHPAELDITMLPGHRIHGRVVDEQKKALAEVDVYYAHGNRGSGFDLGGHATTDARGRFELDSLPADSPIAFQKAGYSAIDDAKLPLDGADEVLVTMLSAGVIRGHVVNGKTGKPVTGFNVRVTFSPDRSPGEPGHWLRAPLSTDGEKLSSRDGAFRLGEFVCGMPLQVTVEAEGYNPAVVRRVVAAADSDARPVEFRLEKIDKSRLLTVAGRLVEEHGKPAPFAEMRLIVATRRPFPRDEFPFNWQMIRTGQVDSSDLVLDFLKATTDAQGRFTFKEARPGNDIEIAFWGKGISQGRREHIEQLSPKEQADLTITATTSAAVRGTIDKKASAELGEVELSGNDDFFRGTLSEKSDSYTYEIRNVPPGGL